MRNPLVAVTLPLAAAGAGNEHGKEMVMKLPAMIFALVLTGIAMPAQLSAADALMLIIGRKTLRGRGPSLMIV